VHTAHRSTDVRPVSQPHFDATVDSGLLAVNTGALRVVECEVRASDKFGPEKTVRKRLLAERGRHPSTEHLETPEMSYLKKAKED